MTAAILRIALFLHAAALVPGVGAPTAMPALCDGDRFFVQPSCERFGEPSSELAPEGCSLGERDHVQRSAHKGSLTGTADG